MKTIFEIVTTLCFDSGMVVLFWNLVKGNEKKIKFFSLISATFCAAFIIGAVSASMRGAIPLILLNALGFVLSFVSVLFTLLQKKIGG